MMRTVFADTSYWIGTAKPRDQWAEAAREAKTRLGDVFLVTTDEVLVEFLSFLAKRGPKLREIAAKVVRAVLSNPNIKVVQQSRGSFLKGLELYEQRADKHYSLVDCISMNAMRAEDIHEVLTSDDHFTQEGFQVLIRASR